MFTFHELIYLLRRLKNLWAEFYLQNSMPFDWLIRRSFNDTLLAVLLTRNKVRCANMGGKS